MVILTPLSDEESSSFDQNNYTYDVFLNFRGEDTRYNFIDHLYKALSDANIVTFLDDEGLQTGDDLKPELKNAIKASRTYIIVLSKNYASSTWCLEELKLILKLHRTSSEHHVIPIFYHVEPTHVRKLKSSFGDSFRQHISTMEAERDPKMRNELAQKIEEWKQALIEVSNLKGMNANGWRETKFIEEIIRDISSKVNVCLQREMPVLIGNTFSVSKITSWLRDGSTHHTADILTIWGLPGIGKTYLAKYIFEMHNHGFERSIFVEDIERNSFLDSQKHLLENIRKGNLLNIHDVDACTIMIEKALLSNQTLIVLDGVDEFEQLDRLLGTKGFHPGSKIIITTRDGSVTEKSGLFYTDVCPKHTKHQLTRLEVDESLELFSWHAFRCKAPREGYEEDSRKVVNHCVGNPLALKVLGSSLRNKDVVEWKETIELLEEGLNPQIQQILQISFHSLPSENEKELFKHIACFFVGKDIDFTEEILKECGIKTQLGFSTLIDRSLIVIGHTNKLMMHQQLQELGRDLVRQESPNKPWKRSRVWKHVESYAMLKQEKATEKVQGLVLDMKVIEMEQQVHPPRKSLEMMSTKNLVIYKYVKKEAPVNFLTDPLEGRSTLRPADILIFGWAGGKHACVDVTGVSPLVGLRSAGFIVGQAALKAATCKIAKHEKSCIENQHVFIPFAFDTFGFLAPEAVELLSRVQRVMHSNVMTPRSVDVIFKRIGFAIQKGVAAQLVARLPPTSM